jgi:stage II sporulation protein M
MDLAGGSGSFDPGNRLAEARFRRWFGRYFLVALTLFTSGAVLGVAVIATTDLGGLADVLEGMEAPFPDRITFWVIVTNNLRVLAIIALGLISFGVVSGVVLLFNGLVVGFVVGGAATQGRLLETFALIVPHGVFELGAFFLVGGLTFRVTHRLLNYLRGVDETAITGQELFELAVLLAVAAVGIVVAAWIEARLTVAIAEALLGPL